MDVNPGDRAEKCGGMMCPTKIESERGEFVITHKCVKCDLEKRKKIEKMDDFNEVIKVSKKSQS